MGLAIALSFNLRQNESIVSRTIPMIPAHQREEWIIRQARQRPAAERAVFLDGASQNVLHLWQAPSWAEINAAEAKASDDN